MFPNIFKQFPKSQTVNKPIIFGTRNETLSSDSQRSPRLKIFNYSFISRGILFFPMHTANLKFQMVGASTRTHLPRGDYYNDFIVKMMMMMGKGKGIRILIMSQDFKIFLPSPWSSSAVHRPDYKPDSGENCEVV